MSGHEQHLIETALGLVRGLTGEEAVRRLFAAGLIDPRACERLVVVGEVRRLTTEGMPRCEALHAAARTCCCSYEKARSSYYYQIKKSQE
ncbi:hypothetical protein [Alistipes sp.]|uniref:hypothetical protein n=1 Tax=Alistipes sp. TaxID=1872444 RepID=UPI003AF17974